MFQHTLDRADRLSAPNHRVTVIASGHGQDAVSQLSQPQPGKLLLQPANRDTAAGIFLALNSRHSALLSVSPFLPPQQSILHVLSLKQTGMLASIINWVALPPCFLFVTFEPTLLKAPRKLN